MVDLYELRGDELLRRAEDVLRARQREHRPRIARAAVLDWTMKAAGVAGFVGMLLVYYSYVVPQIVGR